MTVSSTTDKSGPYNGNGVTVAFDYGFRILDATHITVIQTSAAGVETVLGSADYSVSGVGAAVGGTVTLDTAPPTGETLTIIRNAPFTQMVDLENQGAYFAETIEQALDLATMRDQQLSERLDRAVTIPVSADASTLDSLIADIVRLGDSAANIDTVAGIAPAVSTVAGIAADVSEVSAVAAAVAIVAGIAADVSTVAADGSDIGAVAAISGGVQTVAGIAASVPAVAANEANIDAVAANAANINIVAGLSDEILAVPAQVQAAEDAAAAAEAAAQASGRLRRFATLTAMRASSASIFATGEYVYVEGREAAGDGGGGLYRYSPSDMALSFVRRTLSILTGEINTTGNKIAKTAHGLRTGQGVLVTGGDGLTANTVVYYVRGRLPDEFTFHPTYTDAVANTNIVDLTGTTAFSVKVLADPDQVAFVALAGDALDGSNGGFRHRDAHKYNRWHVEWFPGSGPDDTDQINRAVLAAGDGGEVRFPVDTLVISLRDNENTCLWQLSGQTWAGEDRNLSIVQLSAATAEPYYVVRCVDASESFRFRDMCFDGNRDNITPVGDIYTSYQMITGADGGKHGRWERLKIINSWGRSLQTGYEPGSIRSEDMIVDDVIVLNAGTKAISLTETDGATIKNCYVEVNAYTDAENPGGDGAGSGSCFESNECSDVTIWNNRGKQVGLSQVGPGIRLINGGRNLKVSHNTIDGASYLGFIQNVNDVDFFENTGRNIAGNGILIADADAIETDPTKGIRVFRNTIIDPASAYVLITANKSGVDAFVEAYIYDNVFRQVTGSPTHGIYNYGVVAPATGGLCEVYQWGNKFEGTIPNQLAGAAAIEIQPKPDAGWRILGQSNVAVSHTGSTTETTLATIAVPAYAMGKNGRLRITAMWSYTNSANNKITRVRFGGFQAYAATNTTTAQQRAQVEIGNRNASNSQVVAMPGNTSGFGQTTTAVATLAIDTAANANVSLTGALADAGETITLESYVVEVYYAL